MIQKPNSINHGQFGWVEGESEIFIGSTILLGFALKFQNNVDLPEGTPISFKYFIEEEKKKKGFKSKKTDKIMNVRLVSKNSEFGRLKEEESRVLVPLLVHNMIRVQIFANTIPKRYDVYAPLSVKATIYLTKKSITNPVVQTF